MVYRIGVLKEEGYDSVAGFMVGCKLPFFFGDYPALLFRTCHYLQGSLVKLCHCNKLLVSACCQQRALVEEVFKIGTCKSGCAAGNALEIDVVAEPFPSGVYLKYLLTPTYIGNSHINLSVKASGTQKRVIKDIRTVRRSHDYDSLVGAEAVHLHQKLVQCLLSLIMSAAETRSALTAHRVDLIYENDRRRGFLCLLEKVTDTGRADTYVKLNEIGAGDRQKLYAGFSRDRLGKKCFTCTRRAYQQYAFGYSRAEIDIFFRVLKKINDLLQLRLFLVSTSHVGKRDLVVLIVELLSARLAELHGGTCASAAAGSVHHICPEYKENSHYQQIGYKCDPPWRSPTRIVVVVFKYPSFQLVVYKLAQIGIENRNAV